MIVQTFNSIRKVVTYPFTQLTKESKKPWYTAQETAQAAMRGIEVEEYVRRDNIVKALAAECPFRGGDTAYPCQAKGYAKYGAVMVVGVCETYKDFANDATWPKDDNPMIITFMPLNDRTTHIFCTSNYLQKTNTHLETC